jgi:hypothetical protein
MHTDLPEVIVQFRDNDNYSYIDDSQHVVGEPDMNFIMCNLSADPVSNIKVRQAMAMAISSKEYSKIVDKGVNAPCNQPFIAGSPYYAVDSRLPGLQPDQGRRPGEGGQAETGKAVAFGSSRHRTLRRCRRPSSCRPAPGGGDGGHPDPGPVEAQEINDAWLASTRRRRGASSPPWTPT